MNNLIYSIIQPEMQQVCQPVSHFDAQLAQDIASIREAMHTHQQSALAAIQLGIARQIVVIDITDEQARRQNYVLINPVITALSAETAAFKEQCPSLPGETIETRRPVAISVNYRDPEGHPKQLDAQGYLAVFLQHTLDHLQGRSPASYLSPLKKQRLLTRLHKQLKK
ncbi:MULTISPECIES: peptide deformylase [Tatumella]|uniref:Peptide deformylase-like n=1 Tax=Tatumella punctata TaxID=399969 RepID=A0ABW1VPF9_9GAMM|nr:MULTISPECIES: peptide deformylase [unclassified Tatumella]MBS0856309.1 peptide deformylase [Tatumella sp. JGM16]MBS0876342.1 peptide deformylase [Tatumella sp. JGM82]MBS0889515.1 peptide deformylase [Tatumella sp. JGM94]MBS0894323.1 peptide deformylase [Tatumella sp. JGM130]MBS0900637.1 peptide deformylase [Tatumella sp. JGM100]